MVTLNGGVDRIDQIHIGVDLDRVIALDILQFEGMPRLLTRMRIVAGSP